MKDNTCNYSDEWQPYISDYDKYEYDVKLKDGTIVENCYPNAGKFNSISEAHDKMSFDGSGVVEIRFSERPRFGLNAGVSDRPQYEWNDKQLSNKDNSMVHVPARPVNSIVPVRNSKTDPKIQRNDPCPCGSGKKFKQCCISKP